LKDFHITSDVIHDLILPYSPESNGIAKHFKQTIEMIVCTMTITAPDFHCLLAEVINMAANQKTRLRHKYLLSSTIPFKHIHIKRPTISYLKSFRSKCFVHIREEEHSSGSKYLLGTDEAIIIAYTSSPKIYPVCTLENEYVFMTQEMMFSKKTSLPVATTLESSSQDPEPGPGSTFKDQGPKKPSTTPSVHTRILTEDIGSDQD
jgi:hypothetical protein